MSGAGNIESENVELYGLNNQEKTTTNFNVYTDNVSFVTKLKLLLWKNVKIQMLRRPKSCCCKCFCPVLMMVILILFRVLIPDAEDVDKKYGAEFEYIISNTGDAAQYGYYYNLPWPDTSIANEWIKHMICRGYNDPPSYLAIVANDYADNDNLQSLLTVLGKKYGNSSVYPQTWLTQKYVDGTWTFPFIDDDDDDMNTSDATTEPTMEPTMEPTATQRRRILTDSVTETSPYCYIDPENPETSAYNATFVTFFPPKCLPYSCNTWSRDTTYINFNEGSLLKFFNTEQELEDYIDDTTYGNSGFNLENTAFEATRPIGAAIIFRKTGGDNGLQWEYTLRVNSSDVPQTEIPIDIFTNSNDELYRNGLRFYLRENGLPWLQTWIDEGIMEYIINKQYNNNNTQYQRKMNELKTKTNDYSKGVFQFASFAYKQDVYWTFVGDLFPFFIFIMFVYPIITVLSILVEEKSSKIREGMKMMGATTSSYWGSWIIWFFIEFTAIALLVSIIGSAGGVFTYSSFGAIFLWFWLFCLSSAAFSIMLSVFFDNSKTGSLCGLIIFFALLMVGMSSNTLNTASDKTALCLLAPACFVMATDNIIKYEGATIGVTFDNINDEYNNFAFSTCLIMMFVDILIYLILTMYLDQVWPSTYGQKQPFYFIFLPSYWSKKCGCFSNDDEKRSELQRQATSNIIKEEYENVNVDEGDRLIAIRELTKTFKSFGLTNSSQKEVKAVQQISLDMFRGQVFCLLGHNGAGKTTTISMMTGLLEVTDGNAWIMGHNISDSQSMSEIRKHLGVCPQHDVLWNRLTVKEHLWLFARLKGVPSNVVKQQVDKIAADTGLSADGNDNKFPTQMSGGQKRKLSLGCALIGGSQVVFLDEPTSGMDPQSRRITWDLISKEKQNRCIILTTHFMDEADILGDRIAIMGGGKIKCCGSSLFLKQQYGVGYTFTVSLKADDDTAKEIDNIKRKIDEFVFDIVTDAQEVALAGSELTYRLPFEQTSSFSKLFDILDDNKDRLSIQSYGISITTLEEVFLKIGHDEIDTHTHSDKEEDKIHIKENDRRSLQNVFRQPTVSIIDDDDEEEEEEEEESKINVHDKLNPVQLEENEMLTFALHDQNACQIFFIHVYAILYKRFWWSIRDVKGLICSLFCPVILAIISMGLLTIPLPTNLPSIELSTVPGFYENVNDVSIHTTNDTTSNRPNISYVPIPNNFYEPNNTLYDSYHMYLADENGEMILTSISMDVAGVFNPISKNGYPQYPYYENLSQPFQDYLLDLSANNKPFYNAFLFFPYSVTSNHQNRVWFGVNGSALHSLPITVNLWNNWIINDILKTDVSETDQPTPSIKASLHPLPLTRRQKLLNEQGQGLSNGISAALMLVIALSLIPAGAVFFMVNEKTNLSKHQQLVSGISFVAYWISNYIADFLVGLPASILIFIFIYVFDVATFKGDAAGPFFLTLILFLFSALPFTYLLSFVFSSPSKAQLVTIGLFLMFGLILGMIGFILNITNTDGADVATAIFRIFPSYIFCESLLNMAMKDLFFASNQYNDWNLCGRNYVLMFVEGIGYFILVLLIEYLSTFPALLAKLGFVTNRPLTETDDDLDCDVLEEKKRIMAGIKQDENGNIMLDKEKIEDAVVIAGLRKVYDPAGTSRIVPCFTNVPDANKIEAVKNLYFGVKQSEVFGYLGVNGAGKTTTLATLTGERYPSSGNALIANLSIKNQLKCRRYIGYCPQFDAIFELLTAAEHLKFYAMIKGLSGSEADEQVKVLLSALTLNKYKNRRAGTYSGGNKRKLSVAMAMIGNPPVIFLDEPSTGMDPVSRRFMWEFISTTMSGRCVILTTHSMEECEALCNRVGIMVNGQLKCLGTNQHLKTRFGKGYQLNITLNQKIINNNNDEKEKEIEINNLENELTNNFGRVSLIEHNGNRISYELIKHEKQLKLGQMFNILEDIKVNKFNIIESYALSQTTLEQVFIRMAKMGQQQNQ